MFDATAQPAKAVIRVSIPNCDRLRDINKLGLISGSCRPHYSTESDRASAFPDQIAVNVMPSAITIDYGVSGILTSNGLLDVHSARTALMDGS